MSNISKLSGILLGFVFLFLIYRKIAPDFKHAKAKKEESKSGLANQANRISPEMIKLKNEQIDILKQLVGNDPNKVSGVIKKWVEK